MELVDGILLVDKPKGWTSFDVVAKVRSKLKKETGLKKPKVGHTGTLDPLATGLLIIVTGKYTKRAQEFSKLDKVYETELTLGFTSSTDDDEGEKTKISGKVPSQEEVTRVLNTFIGEQMQLPPAFSAIKIDGKRAYKLAREGKEVVIEPRPVKIYSITEVAYNYPHIKFTTKVSSGTYIRSLAREIGEALGTGAYLSSLRRTSVGSYQVTDAQQIEKLNFAKIHTA